MKNNWFSTMVTNTTILGVMVLMTSGIFAQHNQKNALLIGVQDCMNPVIEKLDYPKHDVLNMKKALSGIGFNTITCMIDIENMNQRYVPTRKNILHELSIMVRQPSPILQIVYLTGHGITVDGKPFFVAVGADLNNCEESMISIDEICEIMNNSSAKSRVLVFDCCRSMPERVIKFKGMDNKIIPGKTKSLASLSREELTAAIPNNICVIMSCQDGENSMEDSSLGGSVFTHFFVEGLTSEHATDRRGVVSVTELFNFVRYKTSQYANNYGCSQNPEMISQLSSSIELVQLDLLPVSHTVTPTVKTNPVSSRASDRTQEQPRYQQRQSAQTPYSPTSQTRFIDRPAVQAAGRAAIAYGLSQIR